jgi:hypothetical protein
MQHKSSLMPSLIQQIDDIINKAATHPPPPLPSTPSSKLIVNIVNQAAAHPPLPSMLSLTLIVDTIVNKAAARRPQPPSLPSTLTFNSILFPGSWHDDDDSWTIEMNEDYTHKLVCSMWCVTITLPHYNFQVLISWY